MMYPIYYVTIYVHYDTIIYDNEYPIYFIMLVRMIILPDDAL